MKNRMIIIVLGIFISLSGMVMAATTTNFVFGGPGYSAVLGDFDGDGKADPAIYQEETGNWSFLLSGSGYSPLMNYLSLGAAGYQGLMADLDGDGKGDLFMYKESTSIWVVMLSSAQYQILTLYGSIGGIGYTDALGDFDGDSKADIAVYQKLTGQWQFLLSQNGYQEYTWDHNLGGPGWIPVLADFDGDGKADPTVYEENSGTWIFALSGNNYAKETKTGYSGGPGWSALGGDYNGDTLADPAVYNRSNGTWNIILAGSSVSTPVNVTASQGLFENYVQVSWSASAGAASYEVFRRETNSSSFTGDLLGTTAATNYLDRHADGGKRYYYRVRALSADSERSGFSDSATGWRYGPDIKVNDSHGPVFTNLGAAITVTVQLDPGEDSWSADFWVLVNANGSFYYLDSSNLSTQWLPVADLSQAHPVYQGPLFHLPPVTVLDSYPWLPRGAYTFYFAVDAMDGVFDLNNLWFDSVALEVQ